MQKLLLTLLSVIIIGTTLAQPQSKEEIARRRQELKDEISTVKADLKATTSEKNKTLGTLARIEGKIDLREKLIDNISDEVRFIETDISRAYGEIARMKKELDTLRFQYAKSIVYAYKNRSNYDFLNFIFSSASFNDAMKRISYLKTYRAYRTQQAERIKHTQAQIQEKIDILNGHKVEKKDAIGAQNEVLQELEEDKKEKDATVAVLRSKENQLNDQLKKKKRQDQQLQAALTALINKEIAEARRIARAKAAEEKRLRDEAAKAKAKSNPAPGPNTPNAGTPPAPAAPVPVVTRNKKNTRENSDFEATPEATALSEKFENNRGNLPWPVDKGVIIYHFGPNKYLDSRIDFNNPGITIETANGATVKAIFDGEVSSVMNLEEGVGVVIRHGKYATVYSVLSSCSVSKGQQVKTGQALGRAVANDSGVGEVSLWMVSGETKVDPERWIRRR